MKNKFFDGVRKKMDKLESERDKEKMRELIIDIIVDFEKFCHRDGVDIHHVLVDARQRCKEEINKPY